MRRIFFGLLLLIFTAPSELYARSGDSQDTNVPTTVKTIGKYAGDVNLLARMTDVAMAPGGRLIVLSQEEVVPGTAVTSSFRLLIGATACLAGNGFANRCFVTIEGLNGVRSLGWSADGLTLFLLENRDTVVAVRLTPGTPLRAAIVGRQVIGHDLGDTIVISGSIPGDDFAQSMQWISGQLKQSLPAGASADTGTKRLAQVVGQHIAAVADYDRDLVLHVRLENRSTDLPLSRGYFDTVKFGTDASFRPVIAGNGWAFRLGGRRWDVVANPAFSRQLFSPIDGRSIGSYSLTDITSVRRSDHSTLAGLSAGASGSILVGAATDGNGSYVVLRKNPQGVSSIALCAAGGNVVRYGPVSEPAATVTTPILGDAKWPLGVIDERPASPKGVAVFFQGGPVGDAATVVDARFAKLYFDRGWAVVSVVYSGTSGFSLDTLKRLGSRGIAAIADDSALVARYLDQRYPNVPVIVHGESFGAIGALALESRLARRRGGLVAIVPYLQSRPSSDWVVKTGLLATNPDYQTRWEHAVIGIDGEASRRTFNENLAALSLSRNPSRSAMFVFSTVDLASRPEDVPPTYRVNNQVLTFRDPHAFILAEPGITAAINAWIDRGFTMVPAANGP